MNSHHTILHSTAINGIYCHNMVILNTDLTKHTVEALEKEMATHSSVLAWRIPGTEEPSGLPSMGSHRVGHDGSVLAAAAAAERIGKVT